VTSIQTFAQKGYRREMGISDKGKKKGDWRQQLKQFKVIQCAEGINEGMKVRRV